MSSARVCMVSLRGVNPHAAWGSNYEFEDVISTVDDVDVYTIRPGTAHGPREWIAQRFIWRRGLRRVVPFVNPGIDPITLEKDYDLFIFICMNPNDLVYLSGITGWKERCKTKICFMVEFYAGWLKEYEFHLSLLKNFDHVALCFSGSVPGVQAATGRPCHHVALGVDVCRFSPFPNPPRRCIDVYSMGRRPEAVHAGLLHLAARKEIFYLHDTIPGVLIRPRNHREHRDLVANCGQRARCFMAYPAKVDVAEETRGQSEVGARFFEGAAAGAVLIGQAPMTPAFARDFDWPHAVIDTGSTAESMQAAWASISETPERLEALGRRNAVEAIRRFDWSYRWRDILRIAGLAPLPALTERLSRLARLAVMAES